MMTEETTSKKYTVPPGLSTTEGTMKAERCLTFASIIPMGFDERSPIGMIYSKDGNISSKKNMKVESPEGGDIK